MRARDELNFGPGGFPVTPVDQLPSEPAMPPSRPVSANCGRLASARHGGLIVLSAVAFDALCGGLVSGVRQFSHAQGDASITFNDGTRVRMGVPGPDGADPPCWHTEPGTSCDFDVCNQLDRLAAGDRGPR